jgi:Tfp pilus assembly protein PilX
MRALRRIGRIGQRGIVGVAALIFILIVAFFAMTQASTISSSNMIDSTRQLDSVEALFLAESAIEHVGYRYVTSTSSTPCDPTELGVGEADVAMGRGVFRVLAVYSTNFDGGSLTNPNTTCRVRVQGEITGTRVTRTLDTLVGTEDDLISISSLNPNFNNNPYTGTRANDYANAPQQWTLTGGTQGFPYIGWDKNGGPDGSRAAFARKTQAGSGTASSGGAFQVPSASPIQIDVQSGKTLRLTFDFRVWTRGNSQQEMQFSPRLVFNTCSPGTCLLVVNASGAAGGACDSNGTAGWCESGPTASGSPRQSNGQAPNGCGYIDTACFESGPADATACPTWTGTYSAQESTQCASYNPPSGANGYETGYLTYVIPATVGTGTDDQPKIRLTSIKMEDDASPPNGRIRGKDGQITWIWIDNLRLSVPALSGGGPSKMWREVAAP